jgi:molybdopterin synthase sulfur carrier subunit
VNGCSVRVRIPGPLRSYTGEAAVVAGIGKTLDALLADLDRQYPGLRFRVIDEQGEIRRHIKFFVNGDAAANLEPVLSDADEVMIVCALSGG